LKNHVAKANQTASIRERKATASLDPQHWRCGLGLNDDQLW
jgi:hypothetical protein